MVDEQSDSKGHGQGWETSVQISDWVQECVVEVGHERSDKRLGSRVCGGGGTRAVRLKLTR